MDTHKLRLGPKSVRKQGEVMITHNSRLRRHTTHLVYILSLFVVFLRLLSVDSATAGSLSEPLLEIKVSDPRPLSAAILILEARTKLAITYEDPPYLYPDEIAVSPEGPLIPKGGSIDFSYSDDSEPSNIIQSLLEAHSKMGNPGIFQVDKSEGFYLVFPLKYRNEKGELIPQSSLLDSPISISAQNISGIDIIEILCDKLSKALNKNVMIGMIPTKPFSKIYESYNVIDQPARSHLIKLIKDSGNSLSWQMLYDPKLKWYVLNIHYIGYIRSATKK